MNRIPIIHLGQFLLVIIKVDLPDSLALRLQDAISNELVKVHAKGVLIDISSLDMVDSFVGRVLGNMTALCHALGSQMVVVGMQPAVAITIVELGLLLDNLHFARNVDQGMVLLQDLIQADSDSYGSGGGHAHEQE